MRAGAAVAVSLVALVPAACGGSDGARPAATSQVQAVKRQLIARLRAKELNFKWVACLRNGRTYKGMAIVRCNVDFGVDPHVEAYCSVLDHGRLVTNHENAAIPCHRDEAGWQTPIVSS